MYAQSSSLIQELSFSHFYNHDVDGSETVQFYLNKGFFMFKLNKKNRTAKMIRVNRHIKDMEFVLIDLDKDQRVDMLFEEEDSVGLKFVQEVLLASGTMVDKMSTWVRGQK